MTYNKNSYWVHSETGMLLGPKKDWEFENFGFYPEGRGDACWRTSLALIAYPDLRHIFSPAVHQMQWKALRYLGPIQKRTPGRREDGQRYDRPRHPHRHFSRDQRIMGMAALYLTHQVTTISEMVEDGAALWQPCDPRYSSRPNLKNWIKYLATGEQLYADRFHTWVWWDLNIFGPPKGYPLHLLSWMLYCCPDEKISEQLLDRAIPEWNLLLTLLNGGLVTEQEVESYRPKTGFQWQSYEWKDPSKWGHGSYLDVNDQFQLDKDVLKWVYNREIKFR